MDQPAVLPGNPTRLEALRRAAQRRPAVLAALGATVLALPALWPLLAAGFIVSDDGLFHVYRIAALAEAWRAGVLYPRLFPDFGFGYGQAVFNFYAPLAYVPGALLARLGLSPAAAAEATIALGIVLAALAAFGLARSFWGPLAGLVAAVAYTYFPYHLADAYVRGALPELFAFIWPPLILWAYAAAFRAGQSSRANTRPSIPTNSLSRRLKPRQPLQSRPSATEKEPAKAGFATVAATSSRRETAIASRWRQLVGTDDTRFALTRKEEDTSAAANAALLWGALAWAALVYTHNLTAVMLAPFFAVYLLILAWWTGRWRRLLPAAGSLLLAIALSAPLWLPFLAESGAVGIALGPSAGYQKHLAPLSQAVQWLPFYHYRGQPGSAADHPLSGLAPALFLVTLALAGWQAWRRRRARAAGPAAGPVLVFGLLLALLAAWLTTAPSLPVWRLFQPVLAQLQYPWRFLALAALGWLLLAGALPVLAPARARAALAAAVIAACLLVALPDLPVKPLAISAAEAWAPDRMWAEDAANGQVGATWTGEFLPLTVREQRWALGRPLAGARDGAAPAVAPAVRIDSLGYQQIALTVDAPAAQPLRLHQFYLPGWTAILDGQPVPVTAGGELGLVSVAVPAGNHRLLLRFGPTPARAAGAALAVLGALAWAGWTWRTQRTGARSWPAKALAPGAAALLLLALAFSLNRFGAGQQTWTPRPSGARLGDVAVLLGADVAPAAGQNAVDVTLYWLALRDVATNYKVFVHLVGPDGQVVAQHDNDPGGGFSPTSRWRGGEVIADRHRLPLDAAIGPGNYDLKAGMYAPPAAGQVVHNLAPEPPASDGRVGLGSIRLPLAGKTP